MRNSKVWMVLGATSGLGYAAVKYLVTNKQFVIAIMEPETSAFAIMDEPSGYLHVMSICVDELAHVKNTLAKLITEYGLIDFVINNSNYRLFNQVGNKTSARIKRDVETSVSATIELITALLPFLRKNPTGRIINIPPQLCLASIPDKTNADRLAWGMEMFLGSLHEKLSTLHCGLTFLQPGERLTEFTV